MKNNKGALIAGGIVSLLIALVFLPTFVNTLNSNPTGMFVSVLCLGGYVATGIGCFTGGKKLLPGLVALLASQVVSAAIYLSSVVDYLSNVLYLVQLGTLVCNALAFLMLMFMVKKQPKGFFLATPALWYGVGFALTILMQMLRLGRFVPALLTNYLTVGVLLDLAFFILLPLGLKGNKDSATAEPTAFAQPGTSADFSAPIQQPAMSPEDRAFAQEELNYYRTLVEKGIVTEEEYQEKKRQLGL